MTRDEAILHMTWRKKELLESVNNQASADIEAFDMAIEALEQEPKTGELTERRMTNWEKWIKDDVDVRHKRKIICDFYKDCDCCPLDKEIDCMNMIDVEKWMESEE